TRDRSTAQITLLVEGRNDAPVITNDVTPFAMMDNQSIELFLHTSFTEIDQQYMELVDVTVSVDDPVKGALYNLGIFDDLGGGVYGVTNTTAAGATASIREMIYTPVENRIPVPTTETAYFTITMTDNKSPLLVNTNTIIQVTAHADSSVIRGLPAGQRFYSRLSWPPFRAVEVTEADDETLQPLSVRISLEPATNGYLDVTGPFVHQGGGVYLATNLTAAQITTALRAMHFILQPDIANQIQETLSTTVRIMVEDGYAAPTEVTGLLTAVGSYEYELSTPDLAHQGFGQAVDTIYEYAVIGSPSASTAQGTNSGFARIFKLGDQLTNDWAVWRDLLPPTIQTNDEFGFSVAINSNFVAVGAPADDNGSGERSGAVYLFERNLGGTDLWGLSHTIYPSNAPGSIRFGHAIALNGDVLAVGAPRADLKANGQTAGAVMIFERNAGGANQWGEVYRWGPTNFTGVANARFGSSVALSANRMLVGAPELNSYNDAAFREGAAFNFVRDALQTNNFTFGHYIVLADPNNLRSFGASVAVRDDEMAIGAPGMIVSNIVQAGLVAVFRPSPLDGDPEIHRIIHRSVDTERNFGSALDYDEDRLLIGAAGNAANAYSGSAYLYGRTAPWLPDLTFIERIAAPVGSNAGSFGAALGMGQGTAIIGAPLNTSNTNHPGYAFLYRFVRNALPVPLAQVADQYAEVGRAFSLNLPDPLFEDPERGLMSIQRINAPDGLSGMTATISTIAGTPQTAGVYRVVLEFTDSRGGTSSVEFRLLILDGSSYSMDRPSDRWRIANFGNDVFNSALETALWGDHADPDADGLSNYQEYLTCGDPNRAGDEGLSISR
ncbi:MAG: putative Ig domain-containing protein, partial [Kiritimatiellia bacterium]